MKNDQFYSAAPGLAQRAPVTRKGRATYRRLLQGAQQTFRHHGYQQSSVAAICRAARVANGTFYQYFLDKEGIFLQLVAILQRRLILASERAISGQSGSLAKLLATHQAFLTCVAENTTLYQLFREAEFVQMQVPRSFYRQLAECYMQVLAEGAKRGELRVQQPQAVAYALLGLQEFLATRWLIWEPQALRRTVVQTSIGLITQGLAAQPEPPERLTVRPRTVPEKLSTNRPLGTRQILLGAAESLFGERGFAATSVAEITRNAGVAQGTFYLYFPSKVAIFAQLVREINRKLIREIRQATAGLSRRAEIECAGFDSFFHFIRRHRAAYRIVREAEFVDEEAGQGYYRRIAAGYVKGLRRAMEAGQLRRAEPEPLAYCLMGLGHFAGLKWLVWEDLDELPPEIFRELMRLILEGVKARS
ncbi:MAG TPA: TetR/AcrR family transcriptional regulator [Candidatus Fraserbacteria bacterium]|nr:TetR/AcrR family transcriptional regulator [Candidatus Fraserbacteria bacterium]